MLDERPTSPVRFVRARFEALAEWGIPTADALAIADATDVDILDAVGLLRSGCPSTSSSESSARDGAGDG